ncbi:hypothetical protein IT072_19725 [Leifsonia sp. ZF2019]|uniref:hypothetical protein n=1 Tax=Leifsonia sp. ZF2019 TaxID=2781978 RepID=UPI001CC16D42|nr:hypothetical protein [Leifsonia sp. ZF2019]UAJ79387.1 hypothetical protein IT072_19725 [Leifsonia sp. ZF2019]
MFDGSRKKQAAAARASLARDAQAAGWVWQGPTPPPPQEICEAALRGTRRSALPWTNGIQPVWTVGLADGVSGTVGDRAFVAGRLAGYARGTTNDGTVFGHLTETTIVWSALPAALPEIRLVDRSGTQDDAGIRLPATTAPGEAGARWSAEGFLPAFASDVLTADFMAALEAAAPCSAIVIRAGVILAYGFEPWDAAAIRDRVTTLDRLIRAVPAPCWNRADALVAGTGVFPHDIADGDRLRLDHRLVGPDWQGGGLSKFRWEDVDTLDSRVVLSGRESVELEVYPIDREPAGLGRGAGVQFGGFGDPLAEAAARGIPTVASTLQPPPA